ncbi:MAG: hypothetical protein A3J93_00890 [Candidatus Magasanikbacteria bacterium RIFOXYC2_FULL_42_28]|uniref:Uncharacterized protein n=1 Tax=Candidatus Magasanikbacteria bacterium RIFOXYC2_FULL_42_28 TaxID=1798704 RepID=A0A1F6NXK3_9BACT|nr:MAG: hypothetical protein A3J93_00890 [Candidatus Magasanikbacteria bacterium RIFOXYC2_FULL_42_28]
MNSELKDAISDRGDFIPKEKIEWLVSYLDKLNRVSIFCPAIAPSILYRGAIFLLNDNNRSKNPDYLSQAAHSLREILYQYKNDIINLPKESREMHRKDFLKKIIAENKIDSNEEQIDEIATTLNDLYFIFTQIAHHFRDSSKHSDFIKKINNLQVELYDVSKFGYTHFKKLVVILTNVWCVLLPQQISIHNIIDRILVCDPLFVDADRVFLILSFNSDAYRYFFTKADERWLDWLWNGGFLNAIKQKSADPTRYSYSLPELGYLERMAENNPEKVADIILTVSMSVKNFNPEVVDIFLHICSKLPAAQIVKLTGMIKNNEWVKLLAPFSRWGFEYEEILKELSVAKEYSGLLELAEAVLTIRSQAERDKTNNFSDNPFYINDLEHTKVFNYLSLIDDDYVERTFKLLLNILKDIAVSSGRSDSKYFDAKENYYLFDVDFFVLDLNIKAHLSLRDNVHDLAATITKLAKSLFNGKCDDAQRLHGLYIKNLPNTQSFYRFRLFIWSLCPEVFKDELKKAFFDIFADEEKYYELYSPEYCHALNKCFFDLDKTDKEEYVKQVFNYFGKERTDKKDETMYKSDGWEILSSIFDNLTDVKKNMAKQIFDKELDQKFEPIAGYGPVTGGMVRPRAPIDLPELNKMEISTMVDKLLSEWSPESLYKKDGERNFLNPLSADGMGNMLVQDIAKRPGAYLDNANLFFQRDILDQHYTYSFLHGIEAVIRQDEYSGGLDLEKLLDLFDVIKSSSALTQFLSVRKGRAELGSTWLVDWAGVHGEISELLKIILSGKHSGQLIDFKKNRKRILAIISYLLRHSDPDPESENVENGSDPFTHAINSVRGRAFESLALFVYLDGKNNFTKEDIAKISEDVKKIYEQILEIENTRAVMFLFGRYLPTFYYRDKEWMKKMIPKIFSSALAKKDLFLAAVEGYLTADLYEELFDDLSNIYKRLIEMPSNEYTKRHYSKELDEGLAIHLALAYVHYGNFDFNSPIFKLFWDTAGQKRHGEFVSYIGRHFISRDDPAEFMLVNKINADVIRGKLSNLWDWILANPIDGENEIFAYFGFWVGEKQRLFTDLKWLVLHFKQSLEKSNGDIEWEHGVINRLPDFANAAPEDTLIILELYLMQQVVAGPGYFAYSLYGDSITTALKTLYKNSQTKDGVVNLINELLVKGSNRFWELKKVIE